MTHDRMSAESRIRVGPSRTERDVLNFSRGRLRSEAYRGIYIRGGCVNSLDLPWTMTICTYAFPAAFNPGDRFQGAISICST